MYITQTRHTASVHQFSWHRRAIVGKTIKSEVVAHYLAMWCAAIILAIWLQCVTDFRYTWRGRDGQVVTVDEHHAKGSGSESRRLKHK